MSEENKIVKNPAREKYLVFLAEDDYAIANMLNLELTMAGYKVVLAENGKLAVERIMSNKPHLILMDINMPLLQGFEVLEELKKKGYNLSSPKIVFLTNSSNPGDIEKAKSYGADYRVKADLTPRELIALADQTLSIK